MHGREGYSLGISERWRKRVRGIMGNFIFLSSFLPFSVSLYPETASSISMNE